MQAKQLNVEEGNKLIAEFMGAEYDNTYNPEYPHYTIEDSTFYPEELKYHSSWDWLIGACKKFDLLYETAGVDLGLDYNFHCDDIDDAVTTYNIEAAFKAIISAIEWYNNLSQQ